ncbi:cell division protein FtsQ/DivIB [Arthrobacter sp. A2-55]|uniref:cell division protein FtsQ/DivIB n=1 Tax=Arthrobacter sp. A2-55 TaxID=2897337 RepID=UPI0021CD2946|nr:cell division protein FtsQ/DivIB [Arthrobacter sp. A2-55]MCU6479190.1 cell division protein FtsQ/DivIB [Arthrobacter sp. A2-55]
MAEPRRPRIIRTRPATGPDGGAPAGAGPGPNSGPEPDGGHVAAATPSAATAGGNTQAARPTSSKVTVTPLEPDAPVKTAPREAAPAKTVTAKTATAKTAPAKAPGRPVVDFAARAKRPAKDAGPVPDGKPEKGGKKKSGTSTGRGAGATVLAFPTPAHKKRRRRAWIAFSAVAAVLAIVMVVALFSPVLAVRTIHIDGRKLVAEKTLQTALAPLVGTPLPQVTQQDVDRLLAKVPQVKSSRIEAQPPSALLVQVVERVPVALLKNGSGFVMVDQDGVELGTAKDAASAGLPLIDGGLAAVSKDTFSAMTAVLATLPKSVLGRLASATAKSPDAVELQMVDGKTVVWGNAADMELKAQVLQALIDAPAPTVDPGKPAPPPVQVYDVSTPRYPVTR